MNHSYDIFFSICWVDIWNEDERTTMKHHSTPLFISQNKDVKCSKQSKNRCIWKAKMVGSHSHGNAIHHLSTVGTYNSILRSRHSYFHVSSKVCIRWTKGDSYQTIPLSFYIFCGYWSEIKPELDLIYLEQGGEGFDKRRNKNWTE